MSWPESLFDYQRVEVGVVFNQNCLDPDGAHHWFEPLCSGIGFERDQYFRVAGKKKKIIIRNGG